MELRILGPLEAVEDGRALDLGGPKPRAVLAVLALQRGEVVSTDRLIDAVWGERAPTTAAKTVQVYISNLRKALGDGVVETRGRGYRLALDPDRLDASRFGRLAGEGRRALAGDEHRRAAELLHEALALWRGPALGELAYEPFAQIEASRLDEARLDALEDRIDADLALGRHAALCGELEALVAEHPLRERLQGQLMLALYRSGRQAEALEGYRAARGAYDEQLGIEPGRSLQALQAAILAQDPALDAPARSGRRRLPRGDAADPVRRSRRGAWAITAGGLLLLLAALGAIVIDSDDAAAVEPNSVAVLDAESGVVDDTIPVGADPGDITAGEGGIWATNTDDRTISQIDPETRTVTSTTAPGGEVDGVAAGAGAVWSADLSRGVVTSVDPDFHRVVASSEVPSPVGYPTLAGTANPIAVGGDSVWTATGSAAVAEIRASGADVVRQVDVGNAPAALALGPSDVWVADGLDNTVTRIDRATGGVVSTTPVGAGPSAIAVGAGGVWVALSQAGQVARLDPASGAVTDTIAVGDRPSGVSFGDGKVWVANSLSGTVSRIDPEAGEVDLTVGVGESPQDVVVSDGHVWVTVRGGVEPPAGADAGEGETLRVAVSQDTSGSIDPAQYFDDSARGYATCALLYNYPDEPAPEGSALLPEVAAGPPEVSDGGRTYTFTVRPGFGFSPPSGEEVTATSFERAIERVLNPELESYGATFMQDIVGARAYARDTAVGLRGVAARGDQLVVRLTAPSQTLVSRLSSPWFCAVPSDTPAGSTGSSPIPSAGPYYFASYEPRRRLVLLRNPNYGGTRPAGLAEIEYDFGIAPEEALERVENGLADYYSNGLVGNSFPVRQSKSLESRYGSGSEPAEEGAQRYFVTPQLGVYYLLVNTGRPVFSDLEVRRATATALDRRALARVPFGENGRGRPTDQLLPPGLPGYRDEQLYPLGRPEPARARRIAGQLDERVVLYVCNLPTCAQFGEIVRSNLARIGLTVDVRQFGITELFQRIQRPGEPFDLAQSNYFVDYPDPFNFLDFQFRSGVVFAKPLFDDPAYEARLDAAAQLEGEARYDAYAKLDHDLSAAAFPGIPYASAVTENFFSERIGCQVAQPIYGIDYARLCLR